MGELPTLPHARMGVYKDFREVPDHHRLERHESAYADEDVWGDYLEWYLVPPRDSEAKRKQADRSFRKWASFMEERGKHYAVATPTDVERWSHRLLNEHTPGYAYTNWSYIERFYSWLQTHPDHPHVYHPFWMAATDHSSAAHELWSIKVTRHWEGMD